MAETRRVYLAVQRCGCAMVALLHDPADRAGRARAAHLVGQWIRLGFDVDRVPLEEALPRLTAGARCRCEEVSCG